MYIKYLMLFKSTGGQLWNDTFSVAIRHCIIIIHRWIFWIWKYLVTYKLLSHPLNLTFNDYNCRFKMMAQTNAVLFEYKTHMGMLCLTNWTFPSENCLCWVKQAVISNSDTNGPFNNGPIVIGSLWFMLRNNNKKN